METATLCELPQVFQPVTFRIKQASETWEHRDAHALSLIHI